MIVADSFVRSVQCWVPRMSNQKFVGLVKPFPMVAECFAGPTDRIPKFVGSAKYFVICAEFFVQGELP